MRECIVVWDRDDPPDGHLSAAAATLPFELVWPGSKIGVWAARNLGADKARAEFLAFLDDDVEVLGGWGEAVKVIVNEGWQAATGPVLPKTHTTLSRARALRNDHRYASARHGYGVTFFAGGNSVIATEVFRTAGGFGDGGVGSDNALIERLRQQSTDCRFHAQLRVLHQHDRGLLRAVAEAYSSGRSDARRGRRVGRCAMEVHVGGDVTASLANAALWVVRLGGHVVSSLDGSITHCGNRLGRADAIG